MVNKFCPKCGIPLTDGNLCTSCTKTTVDLKYDVPLIQISEFNRMFHKGVWRRFEEIEDIIVSRVQEALGMKVEIIVPPIEFVPRPKEKTKFKVYAVVDDKEYPVDVKMSYMQCDYGQKQKTAYFEGVMQLREPNANVIAFIDKEMKQLEHKGVFITKTSEQKNGVDLYFSSKTQMNILGQKIGSRFGAQVSSHAQLFTHNHLTSKDVFRLNILVVVPKFMAGDIISFDYPRKGRLTVHIKNMGKITQGLDVNSDKQIGFELKLCDNIEIYKQAETTISSTHPQLCALDPQTYQEEPIKNKSYKTLNNGDTVSVVKTPYGLYIVN